VRSWAAAAAAATRPPRRGSSSSRRTCWRPAGSCPGARTRCCSRSSARRRAASSGCACRPASAPQRELSERHEGYEEAVLAHLTLLLVGVSRLCADVAGDLRLADEPLLAAVFERIEAGAASLAEVARAVGLTPGHLTTVVRRRTGRTVGQWIAERRMVEARRLLAATDLTVAAIAERAGFGDPSYFVRSFRRAHGTTPLQWRRGVA
jgi:AraC family transcriptional regulator, transcriptional activator of pobA